MKGISRDITDRERVEQALQTQKEELVRERTKLQTIFDAVPIGMLLVDEYTQITRVNNVVAQLVGKKASELLSHQPGDGLCCVHASETPAGCGHSDACPDCPVLGIMTRVLKEGAAVRTGEVTVRLVIRGEERQLCLAVNASPLELDGKKYALFALMDISEYKRAEQRCRVLFESSRDAIMTLAPPSWRFTSGNPATVRMFGTRDEAEFVSLGPWELSPEFQPDGQPSSQKAKEMIETAMKEGTNFFEWQHKRHHAEEFPATVLLTRVELGDEVFLQATVRDITEQKQTEAERNELYEKLVDASRLAGMADVATGVLHNVGNVLNSVGVSAQLVTDKVRTSRITGLVKANALIEQHADHLGTFLTDDERGKLLPEYLKQLAKQVLGERDTVLEELGALLQNVEHIKQIVSMQQSYATTSGMAMPISLTGLVEEALKMNDASLKHDVELVREFEELPQIATDKYKVLQILVNLINNAKHALGTSDTERKRLCVRVARSGKDCVKIDVEDNGVGIAHEDLSRIFRHGFTTKKDSHGFGLHSGALASKELGGALSVHSDGLGQGATFTLELPLGHTVNKEAARGERPIIPAVQSAC